MLLSLHFVFIVLSNSAHDLLFFSAAGPHTIINGKEVVNFSSANYLGLIGHKKLLVSGGFFSKTFFLSIYKKKWSCLNRVFIAVFYPRSHVPLHWKNMVLVPVVLVVSMEQLVWPNYFEMNYNEFCFPCFYHVKLLAFFVHFLFLI